MMFVTSPNPKLRLGQIRVYTLYYVVAGDGTSHAAFRGWLWLGSSSRFWLFVPNSFGHLSGRLEKKGSEAVGDIAWTYLAWHSDPKNLPSTTDTMNFVWGLPQARPKLGLGLDFSWGGFIWPEWFWLTAGGCNRALRCGFKPLTLRTFGCLVWFSFKSWPER